MDWAMRDLANYERDCDLLDSRQDAIENEQKWLMSKGAECDPFEPYNLREAIDETDTPVLVEALNEFAIASRTGKPLEGKNCQKLHDLVYQYWADRAAEIAAVNVDSRGDE